ncbi:hypothetical protein GQR58_000436 [Nymphon striatum]|nr:hypothetical protein GQR58_000436 [Nymphon striatum]
MRWLHRCRTTQTHRSAQPRQTRPTQAAYRRTATARCAVKMARMIYAAVTGSPIPKTSEASAINAIARTSDPCDHCAIISENPLPTPLVTIALFIIPMAVSKIAVMMADRTPLTKASLIRAGPMFTGSNVPSRLK